MAWQLQNSMIPFLDPKDFQHSHVQFLQTAIMIKSLKKTRSFLCEFFLYFLHFFFFFLLLKEKDGKTCLNAEKDDFDHGTACKAPIHWSKYTASGDRDNNYFRKLKSKLGITRHTRSCFVIHISRY